MDRLDFNSSSVCDAVVAAGLYFHSLPGRLRVEAPALRGNGGLQQRVSRFVGSLPGIGCVQINATTARVLITFDPQAHSRESLMRHLQDLGCFAGCRSAQAVETPRRLNVRPWLPPRPSGEPPVSRALGETICRMAAEEITRTLVARAISAALIGLV